MSYCIQLQQTPFKICLEDRIFIPSIDWGWIKWWLFQNETKKITTAVTKNVMGTLNLNLRLFSLNPFYNFIFILWDMEKKNHKINQN
jgi:hypothetical protein